VSATLTESPLPLFGATSHATPAGGRPTTLEERLGTAWHELRHDGTAECPICHTAMRLESGTGRCGGCGSTLS
jgi:hypothetical protein